MIIERTDEVLASADFLNASQDQVVLLVQQEYLNKKSEAKLIEACLQWAEQETKRQKVNNDTEGLRKVLGPIFLNLRFLVLDSKDYTKVTGKSNVLTDTEKCKLLFNIIEKDFCDIPNVVSKIRILRGDVNTRRGYNILLQRQYGCCNKNSPGILQFSFV
jgi:hypothetical protein